jgi:apolipoprotein N-acyltransferase
VPLNFLLAALSALLLTLAFPKFDFAFLAPVALAPLLIAVARERRWRWRFLQGWAAGVIYWAAVCYWIQPVLEVHGAMAGWLSWIAFALFSLAKGLHLAVFAVLAGVLMRTAWAAAAVPALWVAIEWTHGSLGFAWLTLGNAGIAMSVPLRLAPLTGVYGLSFVFAMTAAGLALAALGASRLRLAPLAALPLLYLLPGVPALVKPTERAVLVQPNISETADWTPKWVEDMHDRLDALSFGAGPDGPVELLVWPEVPTPMYYYEDRSFRERVDSVARRTHSYLILNVVPHTPSGAPLNSALLISPDGVPLARYDKMNLVPFGEFVPGIFKALVAKVSSEAGDFAPGTRQTLLPVGSHRIGAFICYESVFPDFVRQFAAEGAGLLVNISNDGWYGHSAARDQHLEIVRMRAAENQRWILRATNDGITSTIDPAGRVVRNLPPYEAGAAVTRYSWITRTTFYSRHGDWFVWLCAACAVAGLAAVKGVRKKVAG